MNLTELQSEVNAWADRNFPGQDPSRTLLGVGEEFGELLAADPSCPDHTREIVMALGRLHHAHLKQAQGIRQNENHELARSDAVADITIFLAHYCAQTGIDYGKVVGDAWDQVRQRDWAIGRSA